MGDFMAGADVKKELNGVQLKLATLEANHVSINDTLDKVSEAVVNQVRISEQIVALDRRHVDSAKAIHKRLDTIVKDSKETNVKVDANHTQITKWGGSVTAVLTLLSLAGLALSVYKALV